MATTTHSAFKDWHEWSSDVAVSKDLVHWKKYPGNPIVGNDKSSPIVVNDGKSYRLYTMHPEVNLYFSCKRFCTIIFSVDKMLCHFLLNDFILKCHVFIHCIIKFGSNGNCYYIGNDNEAVLIDAGLSCRETKSA